MIFLFIQNSSDSSDPLLKWNCIGLTIIVNNRSVTVSSYICTTWPTVDTLYRWFNWTIVKKIYKNAYILDILLFSHGKYN